MSAVFESDLPATDRLVMLSLADHANDDGLCYPSVGRLTRRTGLGERTIQEAIRRLQKSGLLDVQKNGGPKGVNVYFLNIAPPQQPHPRSSRTPADDRVNPRSSRTPTPAAAAPKPSFNHKEPRASAPLDEKERQRRSAQVGEVLAAMRGRLQQGGINQ